MDAPSSPKKAKQAPPPSDRVQHTCANCRKTGTTGFDQCARCKCVRYCSEACQHAHWERAHKHECAGAEHDCAKCGRRDTGFDRCGRCKRAFYCSRTCQRTHWQEHKRDCVRVADQRGITAAEAIAMIDPHAPHVKGYSTAAGGGGRWWATCKAPVLRCWPAIRAAAGLLGASASAAARR